MILRFMQARRYVAALQFHSQLSVPSQLSINILSSTFNLFTF